MKFITSFMLVLFLISCQSNEQKKTAQTQAPQKQETAQQEKPFKDVDVAEFAELMKGDNVVVLDVRTPEETAQGKIEGAMEINLHDPDFAKKISGLDKEKTYLVYCRSGHRSSIASGEMAKQGFKKIYNLVGGYNAWSAEKGK